MTNFLKDTITTNWEWREAWGNPSRCEADEGNMCAHKQLRLGWGGTRKGNLGSSRATYLKT